MHVISNVSDLDQAAQRPKTPVHHAAIWIMILMWIPFQMMQTIRAYTDHNIPFAVVVIVWNPRKIHFMVGQSFGCLSVKGKWNFYKTVG